MSRVLRSMTQAGTIALLLLLVCVSGAMAQNVTVSGTIKDETGSGLPGATVVEKGATAKGTVTDADGKFSLNVSDPNAILVVSFIGYTTQEVAVAGRTTLELDMQQDIQSLEEVVVIGYGTAKKSDLTGAVVSVTGDDLKKMPVSSVSETLTGRMAGVQVTSTEGSPDADIRIRVRGGGSITQDNSPLYMVDGFPVNTIADITPSDIESITVLKDASSTAIYGSRGANGVIIITTKGGKADKISVTYNMFTGFKKIAKTLDVLSPEDYTKWQYEYAVMDDANDLSSYEDYFGTFQDLDLYSGLKGNNWQRQVYGRTGKVTSHDISVRGGSDKFNYSLNYARFDERAIMIGSDFNRNNITLKLNNKASDKINLAFSLRYSNTKINGGGANEQNEVSSADSRLKHAVGYSPIPVDGLTTGDDTNDQTVGDLVNPFVATADNDRIQERKNFNMAGGITWKIIDNLELKSDVGLDNILANDSRFYGRSTYYSKNRPASEYQGLPAVLLTDKKSIRWRNTNILNYNLKSLLPEDHSVQLLLGQEIIKTETRDLVSEVTGFPSLFTSDQAFKLTSQGDQVITVDNNFSPDDKLLSFFGRVNYEFKGRYLFYGTYRADGSSKFLKDNRWGYFPSAAAAWKISEENFMASTSNWLNSLKLRVSFGESGNNNIPVGQTSQVFVSSANTWINGFANYWSASKTLANPDLKWETTQTINAGVDFTLVKGKLEGSIDWYKNNTKDLLIQFPVPGTGYDNQYRNLGETENKGYEVTLNYALIEEQDYGLNISLNMSRNRGKVVSLGTLKEIKGEATTSNWASTAIGVDYIVLTGDPVGLMYGYHNDGRYEVSDFEGYDDTNGWILKAGVANGSAIVGTPVPGMMKLKDITGDGLITIDDREVIGNANPKHTGGFSLNGYAYGFDLTASFNWSYGNEVYNANKVEFTTTGPNNQYRNLASEMASGKRWTNIDPTTGSMVTDPATLEAMNANTTMWSPFMDRYVFSDWAIEDASFLRLNTLTLGYTLPNTILSKAHIKKLRVYATGYNVFVLTNYLGYDPEVSTRRKTALTPGVDYSAYPKSRQIVFGLNLTF